MLTVTEVALTAIALYISYRLSKPSRLTIPRVGPPTVFGYVWTALRFTFSPHGVIHEGRTRFAGRPYVLPTFGGSLVVLSGDDVEFLRSSDDSTFSQPHAVNELLATRQTMDDGMFLRNSYQANVVRTDLNRALPTIVPELVDESALALQEAINIPDDSGSISLPVWHTTTHLIARVSNRALLGKEMCRNKEYTDTIVRFAEFVMIYSYLLKFCPVPLRDAIYFVLSSIFGGKKEPLRMLANHLKQYIIDREGMVEKPVCVSEFIVKAAPPEELVDTMLLGMRFLGLNFGSVHTSSIFMTHTLYDLVIMPEEQREELRVEMREALDKFGGWTKDAVSSFTKLDSLLREVGRYHFGMLGILRRTIREGRLPDGSIVPPGYTCIGDIESVHMDPKIHPDPEVFDPFRFSKLRAQGKGNEAKYLFTGVGKDFLPFGGGRHVCPGRFFVAFELKVMLAHILLNYDFHFPDRITTRPANLYFEVGCVPNTHAKLVFKKRSQQYW